MTNSTSFSTTLNQINRAQTLAATYNGISTDNDGSQTPTGLHMGFNIFNGTNWNAADLKARAGNGTLESLTDTLGGKMGWAGYKINNLSSTYDQDRDKYIAAIEEYNQNPDQNGGVLTAVGLPIPQTEQDRIQLNTVRDNFISIRDRNNKGPNNLSFEKYAETYGQYLSRLNSLQQQTALDKKKGVIDAQSLVLSRTAKEELEGLGNNQSLSGLLNYRIQKLKEQFPSDAYLQGSLDATLAKFNSEAGNAGGLGISGNLANEKVAYNRAMATLSEKLNAKIHEKSQGSRSQVVLDQAFKGQGQEEVANLITAINTLAGGSQLDNGQVIRSEDRGFWPTQEQIKEAGEPNGLFRLAQADKASDNTLISSRIQASQEEVGKVKNGTIVKGKGENGNDIFYLVTSKIDKNGVRITETSQIKDMTLEKAEALVKEENKSVQDSQLAYGATIYAQKVKIKDGKVETLGDLIGAQVDYKKGTKAVEEQRQKAIALARESDLQSIQSKPTSSATSTSTNKSPFNWGSAGAGGALGAGISAGAVALATGAGVVLSAPVSVPIIAGALVTGAIAGVVNSEQNKPKATSSQQTSSASASAPATSTPATSAKAGSSTPASQPVAKAPAKPEKPATA